MHVYSHMFNKWITLSPVWVCRHVEPSTFSTASLSQGQEDRNPPFKVQQRHSQHNEEKQADDRDYGGPH